MLPLYTGIEEDRWVNYQVCCLQWTYACEAIAEDHAYQVAKKRYRTCNSQQRQQNVNFMPHKCLVDQMSTSKSQDPIISGMFPFLNYAEAKLTWINFCSTTLKRERKTHQVEQWEEESHIALYL